MIHDVELELDTRSMGIIRLDGRPLSVIGLHIDAKAGEPALVTFTIRAAVHGLTQPESS